MDIERDGNLIEAGVWFVAAALVLWKAFRSPPPVRRTLLTLAVTMGVFGVSDVVESRTGAWWRPWWLFVWKAACVIGLLICFVRYFRLSKAKESRDAE